MSVYATPKVSRSPKAYPTQPCPLGRVDELSVWGRWEKEAVGPRATLSADARAAREGGPGYPSDLQLPKPQVPCLEALEGVRIFPIPRLTRREAWALARHILVPAARRTKFDGPQFLARCSALTWCEQTCYAPVRLQRIPHPDIEARTTATRLVPPTNRSVMEFCIAQRCVG